MFDYLNKCYKGKKVFITGHTGFKGSWLLKTLSLLGANIRGYALDPNTENDLYCLINGNQICDSVIGDLRDRKRLTEAITDFQPDFVFHLAAQPLVRLSYDIPSETFEVNAVGTANVLDGIRVLKKKCTIVLITTDKVYQNNEWVYPYREEDRLGGYDPYSASKACTELVIDSYRSSFFNVKDFDHHGKAIAVGRAGNVVGGGDWSKDRLVPDIAKALGSNQQIVVRNPGSVRPWQHVLEPISAYLILGEKLNSNYRDFGKAYNFGPEGTDTLPVSEMVRLSIEYWGKGEFRIEEKSTGHHEAGLLKLDISKAVEELGWRPKLNARQTVKVTMDWYKLYYQNKSEISDFTTNQILEFFDV